MIDTGFKFNGHTIWSEEVLAKELKNVEKEIEVLNNHRIEILNDCYRKCAQYEQIQEIDEYKSNHFFQRI